MSSAPLQGAAPEPDLPSGAGPRRRGETADGAGERVRRVLDHVRRHPADGLSTASLAQIAGVSARALQDDFQREVGTSPMAYVRAVRLERVHEELTARAGEVSITDVATRWGFFHLSRFAYHYRQRFGVLPSVTVRRARAAEAAEPSPHLLVVGNGRSAPGCSRNG